MSDRHPVPGDHPPFSDLTKPEIARIAAESWLPTMLSRPRVREGDTPHFLEIKPLFPPRPPSLKQVRDAVTQEIKNDITLSKFDVGNTDLTREINLPGGQTARVTGTGDPGVWAVLTGNRTYLLNDRNRDLDTLVSRDGDQIRVEGPNLGQLANHDRRALRHVFSQAVDSLGRQAMHRRNDTALLTHAGFLNEVAYRRRLFGPEKYVDDLNFHADLWSKRGKSEQAGKLAEQALKTAKEKFGETDWRTLESRSTAIDMAIDHLQRARNELKETRDPRVATNAEKQIQNLTNVARKHTADQLRIIQQTDKDGQSFNTDNATARIDLLQQLRLTGQNDQATALLESTYKLVKEAKDDPNNRGLVTLRNYMIRALLETKEFEKVKPLLDQARRALDNTTAPEKLFDLALKYIRAGDKSTGEQLLDAQAKAETERSKQADPNRKSIAEHRRQIAHQFAEIGKPDKALAVLNAAYTDVAQREKEGKEDFLALLKERVELGRMPDRLFTHPRAHEQLQQTADAFLRAEKLVKDAASARRLAALRDEFKYKLEPEPLNGLWDRMDKENERFRTAWKITGGSDD